MDKEHALLLTHHIKPDYGFYIQSDDRLACVVLSSVASLVVRFSGYYLSAKGEVNEYAIDVSPTSDRAATSQIQSIGEGFILSCRTSLVSGNANRGQCYVRAGIQRNTGTPVLPLARLLAGYLTDDYTPSFPFGKIEGPLEGPGIIRVITGTDPAAGAEISETVPTGARWRLFSVRTTFVTDATVANRLETLTLDDGTTIFFRSGTFTNHAASLTWAITWASGVVEDGTNALANTQAIPREVLLSAGYRINTSTINLQAGDNWGAPILHVEEWIEA